MRKESQTNLNYLSCVGAVIGVALAVSFVWLQPLDGYMLRHWQQDLATLSDEEVRGRVEQIAAVGSQSLPILATALHSDRRVVANSAASVLELEIERLMELPADESTPVVAKLADTLARQAELPGPYSGPASVRLATRLLLWPIDRKRGDSEQIVADCESIIHAATGLPQIEQDFHASDLADSKSNPAGEPNVEATSAATDIQDKSTATLVESPAVSTSATARRQPHAAGTPAPANPAAANPPPELVASRAPRVLHVPPTASYQMAEADEIGSQGVASQPTFNLPQSGSAVHRPNPRTLQDLEVMRLLVASDDTIANEAVSELYRRGFQAKHLRLVKVLVDHDPTVRLRLVQSLPQMSGVDSRPWLLWLSQDPDPIVRRAAVAVIATSSDPALQQRLRELEQEETDEEVLQVVRQILGGQQGTLPR